jgi:copper resistance protein D
MKATLVVDFLHLLATVTWIGGMLFMKLVLMPAMEAIDPPQRGLLMGAAAKRFTIVAWSCTVVLLATGFLKTPGQYLFDSGTTFGTLLLIKHVVIVLMIVVGLVITLSVAPRLRALAPAPGKAPSPELAAVQKRLEALSATNTVLGLVVLLLVAMLRA